MKKILLASTMLVSVAGYAAADVAVSGDARMGVVSTDNETAFSSRMRIKFSGSGTTDGGLSFGGSFRANDAQGAKAGTAGSVFISGAFGKISMGDVDSGDAASVGQLASVGYTGLGSTNSINYAADGFDLFGLGEKVASSWFEDGYDDYYEHNDYYDHGFYDEYWGTHDYSQTVTGGSAAKVLYTYSAGGLTINASTSQISNNDSHSSYGLGASYTTGGLTLAAGYGSNEFDVTGESVFNVSYVDEVYNNYEDYWSAQIFTDAITDYTYTGEGDVTDASVSATYVMGDTTVKAIYQDKQADITMTWQSAEDSNWGGTDDLSAEATSYGASVVHKMDALTLTAFAVTTELSSDLFGADDSVSLNRYGLGVSYDLGGGASLAAGAVRVETPDVIITEDGGDTYADGVKKDAYNAFDVGVNFSF